MEASGRVDFIAFVIAPSSIAVVSHHRRDFVAKLSEFPGKLRREIQIELNVRAAKDRSCRASHEGRNFSVSSPSALHDQLYLEGTSSLAAARELLLLSSRSFVFVAV